MANTYTGDQLSLASEIVLGQYVLGHPSFSPANRERLAAVAAAAGVSADRAAAVLVALADHIEARMMAEDGEGEA